MKYLLVGAIALMSFSACGTMNNDNPQEAIEEQTAIARDVDVNEFAELIASGNGVILDVRTPEEYADGHIEGCTLLNIYDESFARKIEELDPETPVYVYCRSGGRSGNAMKYMNEQGFSAVYNLDGGITAWEKAGKEVVK